MIVEIGGTMDKELNKNEHVAGWYYGCLQRKDSLIYDSVINSNDEKDKLIKELLEEKSNNTWWRFHTYGSGVGNIVDSAFGEKPWLPIHVIMHEERKLANCLTNASE